MTTHHVCCEGTLACSGINPCRHCLDIHNRAVLARAMQRTTETMLQTRGEQGAIAVRELLGAQSPFWGIFFTAYEDAWRQLHAHMMQDPEITRRAFDLRRIEAWRQIHTEVMRDPDLARLAYERIRPDVLAAASAAPQPLAPTSLQGIPAQPASYNSGFGPAPSAYGGASYGGAGYGAPQPQPAPYAPQPQTPYGVADPYGMAAQADPYAGLPPAYNSPAYQQPAPAPAMQYAPVPTQMQYPIAPPAQAVHVPVAQPAPTLGALPFAGGGAPFTPTSHADVAAVQTPAAPPPAPAPAPAPSPSITHPAAAAASPGASGGLQEVDVTPARALDTGGASREITIEEIAAGATPLDDEATAAVMNGASSAGSSSS